MALTQAIGIGAIAAVAIPMAAERTGSDFGGLLAGQYLRIPIAGGIELHWSWLIFAIVTLFAWLAFKAAGTK